MMATAELIEKASLHGKMLVLLSVVRLMNAVWAKKKPGDGPMVEAPDAGQLPMQGCTYSSIALYSYIANPIHRLLIRV